MYTIIYKLLQFQPIQIYDKLFSLKNFKKEKLYEIKHDEYLVIHCLLPF